jgi:hypothetical protein
MWFEGHRMAEELFTANIIATYNRLLKLFTWLLLTALHIT